MTGRDFKAAAIPLAAFICCVVLMFQFQDSTEGSASQGYVKDGRYFLSTGHGTYQETDGQRFASLMHKENVLHLAFAGMVISGLIASYLAWRARMPWARE